MIYVPTTVLFVVYQATIKTLNLIDWMVLINLEFKNETNLDVASQTRL